MTSQHSSYEPPLTEKEMLLSEKFSDLSLVCPGGENTPARRSALARPPCPGAARPAGWAEEPAAQLGRLAPCPAWRARPRGLARAAARRGGRRRAAGRPARAGRGARGRCSAKLAKSGASRAAAWGGAPREGGAGLAGAPRAKLAKSGGFASGCQPERSGGARACQALPRAWGSWSWDLLRLLAAS